MFVVEPELEAIGLAESTSVHGPSIVGAQANVGAEFAPTCTYPDIRYDLNSLIYAMLKTSFMPIYEPPEAGAVNLATWVLLANVDVQLDEVPPGQR
jgi:hypothetical protein